MIANCPGFILLFSLLAAVPSHAEISGIAFNLATLDGFPEPLTNQPSVLVEKNLPSGDLLLRDGGSVGRFEFHDFPAESTNRGGILELAYATPAESLFYQYLYNSNRTQFTYLSVSRTRIDPGQHWPFYEKLFRLQYAHRTLQQIDFLDLSPRSQSYPGFPFPPSAFQASLSAHVIGSILTRALEDPDWNHTPWLDLGSFRTGFNTLARTRALLASLEVGWDQLTAQRRLAFLTFFRGLQADETRRVAQLWIDLLDHLPPANGPIWPQRSDIVMFGTRDFGLLLSHSELADFTKRQLYQRLLAEYQRRPQHQKPFDVLNFSILDWALRGPDSHIPSAEEKETTIRLLNGSVGNGTAPYDYNHIGRYYSHLLDADAAIRLNADIADFYATRETWIGQTADWANCWDVLDEPLRTRISAGFTGTNLDSTTLEGTTVDGLNTVLTALSGNTFQKLPQEIRTTIVTKSINKLLRNLSDRHAADTFFGAFDSAATRLVQLIYHSDRTEYTTLLLPLIEFYNPRLPAEDETAYANRRSNVVALLVDHGLLVADLKGNLAQAPERLTVFANLATNFPGWCNSIFISLDEDGAEAKNSGTLQFNPRHYGDNYTVARMMLHELGHTWSSGTAMQSNSAAMVDLVATLSTYHYGAAGPVNSNNWVSSYAAENIGEFWAENVRFFHLDTRYWLNFALDRFAEGHETLLNQFLLIWQIENPSSAPSSDVVPLFHLGQDGILQREPIPGRWIRGDLYEGSFEFVFDGNTYLATWHRHRIATLRRNGEIIKSINMAPELHVPTRQRILEFTSLTLTNWLFDVSPENATFEILGGPAGADLDRTTGILHWTPSEEHGGTTNTFVLRVTDSGVPPLSTTNSFQVIVDEKIDPISLTIRRAAAGTILVEAAGGAGPGSFEMSADLTNWAPATLTAEPGSPNLFSIPAINSAAFIRMKVP